MDFIIISQPSTYYKKRVDFRVSLFYARKIMLSFCITFLLFIVFLILFVDQNTAGLPVKAIHGEHMNYLLEEPYHPRIYISGLIVLFSLLILLYLIYDMYRLKRHLIRAEKRIFEGSDTCAIHFTDSGIQITEYEVSSHYKWSCFSSFTVAREFVVIADYMGFSGESFMIPRALFTEEQIGELRNKIKEVY